MPAVETITVEKVRPALPGYTAVLPSDRDLALFVTTGRLVPVVRESETAQ